MILRYHIFALVLRIHINYFCGHEKAMTPISTGAVTAGIDMALAMGKGFDQDQISKLQDACGICNTQQISPIWVVIQGSKGKSFDTYHAHLANSLESWCHSHHINKDKSIFFDSKFLEDLVALQLNPGRGMAQYQWAVRACRCLRAGLSLQLRQSTIRTTRKWRPTPPTCDGSMISLRGTAGRRWPQGECTWS